MRTLRIVLCLLALLSSGLVVIAQDKKDSHKQATKLLGVGETAPNWELSDAEGKLHSLSEYRGKVVVIAEKYKVSILPAVYIIGADGKVIYSHEGVDDKNFGSFIDNYLKNVE